MKNSERVYQTKCSVSVLLFPNPNSSCKAVIISADGTVSEKFIPRVITCYFHIQKRFQNQNQFRFQQT
jgi:hypothetical protein